MGAMSFENTAPMHDVRELREMANALRPSVQPDKPPFNSKTTAPMFPRDPAVEAVIAADAADACTAAARSNSAVVASVPMGASDAAPLEPVSSVCRAAPSVSASMPVGSTASPLAQTTPDAQIPPPSARAMPAPPAAPESSPSTGARNSTSVLFSLASLSDKEQATTRALQQTLGATDPDLGSAPVIDATDDSGMIDLHRLMPSGSKLSVQLVKPVTTSDPPLVAVARDVERKSTYPRRVALFALFGALLAIGAIIGLRFVWKWAAQKEAMRMMAVHEQTQAAAPPAAPAPPPAPEPAPPIAPLVPPPPPEAEISAAASASEANISQAVKSKSHKHRHHRRSAKSAPSPAPAPASNDPCHCGSDLACAMRCASANGR